MPRSRETRDWGWRVASSMQEAASRKPQTANRKPQTANRKPKNRNQIYNMQLCRFPPVPMSARAGASSSFSCWVLMQRHATWPSFCLVWSHQHGRCSQTTAAGSEVGSGSRPADRSNAGFIVVVFPSSSANSTAVLVMVALPNLDPLLLNFLFMESFALLTSEA